MDLVSGVFAILCLGIGLFHLVRLVVPGAAAGDEVVGGPVGEASHAVMALGMAAMFSSRLDLLPGPVWTIAFVLCAAWFTAVALRNRSLVMDSGHHVIGHVAMLFMLSVGHGASTAPGAAAGGHGGHAATGGSLGSGSPGILAMVVSILFAGYFVHHALRCADRMRTDRLPPAPAGAVALRVRLLTGQRTVAMVHLLMAVAMALMLLIMI